MSLVEGENQCLGKIVKIRFSLRLNKHFRINGILKRLENKLNLSRIDYGPVKLLFCVVL